MKILKDSGVNHWIHTMEITCSQCATVYQTENDEDFIVCSDTCVNTTCHKCGYDQDTYRFGKVEKIVYPWYPTYPVQPYTPWKNPLVWNGGGTIVTNKTSSVDNYNYAFEETT